LEKQEIKQKVLPEKTDNINNKSLFRRLLLFIFGI